MGILQQYQVELLQLAVLVLMGLVILTSILAVIWVRREARLPAATRFTNLEELVAQKEALLGEKEEAIRAADQKIQDRDRVIAEVSALEERLENLRMEHDQLAEARREIEETKREAAEAAGHYAEEKQRLVELRSEVTRLEALNEDIARLTQRKEDLTEQLEDLKSERSGLDTELQPLRAERDVLWAAKEEATQLGARKALLSEEITSLERELEPLSGRSKELAELKTEASQLRASKSALDEEIAALAARKDRLEETVRELGMAVGGEAEDAGEALLADLKQMPECLTQPATLRNARRTEDEALADVSRYLEDLGLRYDPQTILAFHTSLKVNDYAQLTILSGVSGTGKSLLPRRYAEAMGMHFLPIAVEPRWDSPQDLLGFYNYIEKRYRATELARALIQMDPYDTSELSKSRTDDHMLLVLLDEMNLARVEYYFSEFLVRLEARPRYEDADQKQRRRDAELLIDIRSQVRAARSVFPGHNTLFTGTMNDDESTQALSDKVLDRSNVMQFSAPKEFSMPQGGQSVALPVEGQSFSEWRSWVRGPSDLEDARRRKADQVIKKLASIMDHCGRPFGHRLYEAMIAFATNYPATHLPGYDISVPLADQIELRILPKLRGVELEGHEESLSDLAELVRRDLGDARFAQQIEDAIEQSASTGLFLWRGRLRVEV